MVMTAIAVECAERDALNAKHAARIPPICRLLPTAIERRAKTVRFVVSVGFTNSAFKPTSRHLCRLILLRAGLPLGSWRSAPRRRRMASGTPFSRLRTPLLQWKEIDKRWAGDKDESIHRVANRPGSWLRRISPRRSKPRTSYAADSYRYASVR